LIVKNAFPAGFPQQKQTYIGYWRKHGLIFNIFYPGLTTVRLQATLTLSVCLGMGLLLLDEQAKAAENGPRSAVA